MTRLAMTIGTILIPTAARAHPGHGPGEGFGLSHYLADPFHVWTGVIAVGLALLLLVAARRVGPRWRKPRPSGSTSPAPSNHVAA